MVENDAELRQARETIDSQKREIDDLRRLLAGQLREALTVSVATATIASPATESGLLEAVVDTAAYLIGAKAASLYLVDEEAGELVFRVTTGPKAKEVRQFRLPLNRGIAGLVAATGQPMAISDADEHPDEAREIIASAIDYHPKSILCAPLTSRDRVIGVLQLLDKVGGDSFTPEDLDQLGMFARQAALAVEQMALLESVGSLFKQLAFADQRAPGKDAQSLARNIQSIAKIISEDPAHQRAVELASFVSRIAGRGEDEATLCKSVLAAIADYVAARGETSLTGGIF